MALINYSDVIGPILNGNADDKVNLHNGYVLVERVGYAKITPILQTNIPVWLPSSAQTAEEKNRLPDKRLIVPNGATIVSIALRLPKLETDTVQPQYGNLHPGATLIGTTGENVKVATDATYDTTAPAIASASNSYTPNATAIVNRSIATPANVAASSLIVAGSDLSISVVVSNAANNAAGTGIRTSAGDAFAIVAVRWYEPAVAPTYEEMGYLSRARG